MANIQQYKDSDLILQEIRIVYRAWLTVNGGTEMCNKSKQMKGTSSDNMLLCTRTISFQFYLFEDIDDHCSYIIKLSSCELVTLLELTM